jgi:hypothetical protein
MEIMENGEEFGLKCLYRLSSYYLKFFPEQRKKRNNGGR